ncbi:YdcF family protein [Actinoplanes palleronii]|uniref:DUF218 domain-containing protein n=1 Tax=Actinoplanes palleronii TaxID=113570 RepID=A0ABQ4BMF0_9ACTN|nr:hypothetical protein Apa02nite_079490 [Actinoplanes palleronii]
MTFEILPGTPGLTLDEVAHVLIPGRGRNAAGDGLTSLSAARVEVAAFLYRDAVGERGGRVVCSGYRSPVDNKGRRWTTEDAPGEFFQGLPEADAMRRNLAGFGIPPELIRVERHSVDTVTNLLRSEHEGHFGDSRPVAIVAQRAHLSRMLSIIAPRTLRRPYLGVIVPESRPESESPLTNLSSRVISAHLPTDPQRAITVATRRAESIWSLAQLLGKREYH